MRIQSLRSVVIASLLALIFIYSTWWAQMIRNPEERNATDFMAFYAAGRIAQSHGYPDIYNIQLQQNVQQDVLGFQLGDGQVLLYNHLPYLVPILAVIVNEDYKNSFIRWEVLLGLLCLSTTVFLINSLFTNEDSKSRLMLAAGVFTFFPMFVSVWQGQDTAFLFLGVALWCAGILKKQDMTAAIGLALVSVRPHLCIALALPLVFKHRRIWWRFIAIASSLAIFSLLILTPKGSLDFISLLRISAEGKWFGMKPEAMLNLLGLIIRSIPSINIHVINITSWVIYGVGLAVIAALWIRSQAIDERLLGLTVLIATITAPHLHLHDLTLLVFPLLIIIKNKGLQIPQPALLLIGTSFIFIAGMLIESIYFLLPYGVYIFLMWSLLRLDKITPLPDKFLE